MVILFEMSTSNGEMPTLGQTNPVTNIPTQQQTTASYGPSQKYFLFSRKRLETTDVQKPKLV